MLRDLDPLLQSLLGSSFTWAVTALGASLVFFFDKESRKILDASLGFAAGVMTAASFWSLLSPALEMSQAGWLGHWGFVPVAFGFLVGAFFVACSEPLLHRARHYSNSYSNKALVDANGLALVDNNSNVVPENGSTELSRDASSQELTIRQRQPLKRSTSSSHEEVTWKRVMLLVLAITVHNIPEGLAVGVGFGAIGKAPSATFESARNLALGIGIQNFPEGLAVSVPLLGIGYSKWRAFFWGQLSGAVEPLSAALGAWAVHVCEPLLPFALSFAAGAMMFVVIDDIVPQAHHNVKSNHLASWSAMLGFVVMMSLDVALG